MAVLVTGGCGLVGLHTARYFASKGEEVVCYDKVPPPKHTKAVVGDLDGDIEFVDGHLEDSERLEKTIRSRAVSAIVHSAAMINEKICRQDSLGAMRVNVVGTAILLDIARRAGVRKLIYTSSATVYGPRPDERPIREDETQPDHVYGYSKFLAEQWIECCRKVYGIGCSIVRLSSVYGPGRAWAPDRYPKQKLCMEAIKGHRYTMEDGGDYRRDFTYVTDVAAAIYLVYATATCDNHVFNVSAGKLFTLRDVADILNRLFPRAALSVAPGRFDGNVALQGSVRGPLSIERARHDLGFSPSVDLSTGLQQYTAFIAEHYLSSAS